MRTLTIAFVGLFILGLAASATLACDGGGVKQAELKSGCGAKAAGDKQAATKAACAAICGKKAAASCASMKSASADCCDPASAMGAACKAGVVSCKSTRIVYRVDREGQPHETMNRAEAFQMAGMTGAMVRFVVNGETYDAEPEAKKALASNIKKTIEELLQLQVVEGEADKVITVSSAEAAESPVLYRVVGKNYGSRGEAEVARAKATAAAGELQITESDEGLKVGDKVAESPTDAQLLLAQEQLVAVLGTAWGSAG